MKEQFINDVLRTMQTSLSNAQLLQLQAVLQQHLASFDWLSERHSPAALYETGIESGQMCMGTT